MIEGSKEGMSEALPMCKGCVATSHSKHDAHRAGLSRNLSFILQAFKERKDVRHSSV